MNETNSSAKHYGMVVIGSGAAGHHGAIQAAKLGKKIAVVERSITLGGASINTGTIPSKALREAVMRSTRSGSTPGGSAKQLSATRARSRLLGSFTRRTCSDRSVSCQACARVRRHTSPSVKSQEFLYRARQS